MLANSIYKVPAPRDAPREALVWPNLNLACLGFRIHGLGFRVLGVSRV